MAVAYGTNSQPGLLSQQYAPALLPKPGKDNLRLQKLLKRTAKKKAAAQSSQSTTPFRSSLSPVNEASPDLEYSTPPRTPEALSSFYSVQQPPRFSVRPLYQHVASPYPQRAAYGRAARMSPPTAAIPSYSVTTYSSYTALDPHSGGSSFMGQVPQPVVAKTSQLSSAVPEITVEATEVKKPEAESHAGPRSATAKPKSPGPTPYPEAAGQAVIRPLTVLTPFIRSKSPRPRFKATERSKSPRPMFEVPKIRMYTASTSYYETSRTPPVYDSAGLTAIGGIVAQSKTFAEDFNQASEVRESLTTTTTQPPPIGTYSQRKTPPSESKRGTAPTTEIKIPTSELRRATSPAEINRATQSQNEKATLTQITSVTPTPEIRSTTQATEIKSVTPTPEIRSTTQATQIKSVTPTPEIRSTTQATQMKSVTPTPEVSLSRMSLGRARTPAFHAARAKTPVFEISRPNPLLFAVSPIPVEPERSRTPKTISSVSGPPASQTVNITELPEILPNGDIHSDIPPADKATQQEAMTKSEPGLTSGMIPAPHVASKRSNTPTYGPPTPVVTGYQRPKTPTHGPPTPVVTGYQRPKTPSQGPPTPVVTGYQRPKTPTQGPPTPVVTEYQRPKTPTQGPPTPVATGYQRPKTPTHGPPTPVVTGYQRPKTPTQGPPTPVVTGYQRPKTPTQGPPTPVVTGYQRPKTPTQGPPTPVVTGYQRPKTPTHEASRLMSTSPGYKRPKTPTYGTSSSPQKHVPPVSQKPKTGYRGLTPAEYAAYGGIKTHSSAFGFSSSVMLTHDEVKAEQKVPEDSSQEQSVKEDSTVEVAAVKETSKDVDETHQVDQKFGANSSVPIIVVSQASDSPGSMLTQETSSASGQVAKKQDTAVFEEVKHPDSSSEKKKAETQIQEITIPETKCPPPKDSNQDPLKAVKKLFGKDKVQAAEKMVTTEKKADASLPQESLKSVSATMIKPEASKPALLAKVLTADTGTADKGKDKKDETASAEKKEGDETLPATEPLLKVIKKPKAVKSKFSGWSRLKKHMVVEQEEPIFPETNSQKEVTGPIQGEEKMLEKKLGDEPKAENETQTKDPNATKRWDAVLFQMFSSKENIMHQIELNKMEKEKEVEKEKEKEVAKNEPKEIPSFAHRLPVLLFSPKFDAKRLREAASRPVTKISTVFEMGLIGRKGKDEEPKDFNRTARGFTST